MCDWWDERLLGERYRKTREDAEKLKKSVERQVPSRNPEPERNSDRHRDTQPEAVPV